VVPRPARRCRGPRLLDREQQGGRPGQRTLGVRWTLSRRENVPSEPAPQDG
jgi:hypothetical protein